MFRNLGKTEWFLMIHLKKHIVYSNIHTTKEYQQCLSDYNTDCTTGITTGWQLKSMGIILIET